VSKLVLDLPTLNKLSQDLTAVANTFNGAAPVSHQLSEAVGDDGLTAGLAGRVGDFADGWDIRRAKITEAMVAINASVKAIHDTFSQVDTALANVLTQVGK
jgi:hypothetical protein